MLIVGARCSKLMRRAADMRLDSREAGAALAAGRTGDAAGDGAGDRSSWIGGLRGAGAQPGVASAVKLARFALTEECLRSRSTSSMRERRTFSSRRWETSRLPSSSVTIFHRFPIRNLSKVVIATGRCIALELHRVGEEEA